MSISSQDVIAGPFTGDGATTAFPFEMQGIAEDEVIVYEDGSQISSALYTVAVTDTGGTVTYTTAPATDVEIVIVSAPSFESPLSITDNGPFNASDVESAIDRGVARDLWLKANIDKLVPAGALIPEAFASKFLAWDADGDPYPASGTGADEGLRDDLAGSSGGGLVSWIRSGVVGAVALTLASTLTAMPLSPAHFGAIGDGSDETTELQAWLDALAGGAAGVVPHGKTYGYSSNLLIKSGTRLLHGMGGTLKALAAASIVIEHDATHIKIIGLDIDVNDQTGQGIWGHNNQHIEICWNRIRNCSDGYGIVIRADAIYAQDVDHILIEGNFVDCVGAAANQFGIWVDAQLVADAASTWTHDGTAGDQGSAVGTLVTSTWKAKNVRIIGNEVVGGYYAIGGFFLEDFVIANNICRDLGVAVDGPVRGIALEYSCKRGVVTGNRIRNTQSSSIHIAYGCEDITATGNNITNTVTSYGTVGVNGSQALLQAQAGCPNITFADNDVIATGGANGAEFMCNIGPHCHRARIINNRFYGKVSKAGINVESTYDSSALRATSYASIAGFDPVKWATATLADVEIVGNTIHLTNAKAGVQVIQAASISISGLILKGNILKGSATANSLIVSSGTLGYGTGTVLTGSATDDVGSISAARIGTTSVTVTGAAVGDYITGLSTSAAIDAGLQMTAEVTAANTVTVKLGNLTAGAVDPASMTYYVEVTKR